MPKKARSANVKIEEAVAATRARPSRVEEVIDEEETAQSQTRSAKNNLPTSTTTQHSDSHEHPF